MPVVGVDGRPFLFETDKAMQDERRQTLARLAAEGRRRVESAAYLGGINAQESHAPEPFHVDRVAVEHGAHEHGIGARQAGTGRDCLTGGNNTDEQRDQILHSPLQTPRLARIGASRCKRSATLSN